MLNSNELLQIIDLMLNLTAQSLKDKDIAFSVSEDAKKFILEKGTDLKYGARPLRRTIQRYIEDEISDMILRGDVSAGQIIYVDSNTDSLTFEVK